jgi:hypothetical protein
MCILRSCVLKEGAKFRKIALAPQVTSDCIHDWGDASAGVANRRESIQGTAPSVVKLPKKAVSDCAKNGPIRVDGAATLLFLRLQPDRASSKAKQPHCNIA